MALARHLVIFSSLLLFLLIILCQPHQTSSHFPDRQTPPNLLVSEPGELHVTLSPVSVILPLISVTSTPKPFTFLDSPHQKQSTPHALHISHFLKNPYLSLAVKLVFQHSNELTHHSQLGLTLHSQEPGDHIPKCGIPDPLLLDLYLTFLAFSLAGQFLHHSPTTLPSASLPTPI